MYLRRRALLTAAKQAIFRLRTGRLGPLALILTVAAVQSVGATILPGCFGNRGLSCRGTKSSNPSPSSGESGANLIFGTSPICAEGPNGGAPRRSKARTPVNRGPCACSHGRHRDTDSL